MKAIAMAAVLLGSVAAGPAFASEHWNLEENLPTQMEDAYAAEPGHAELQVVLRYLDEGDEHRVAYTPILEMGLAPGLQLDLSGEFYSGNADRQGSGNLGVELLYNFYGGGGLLPAAAVVLEADLPTGTGSAGVDVTAKLVLTSPLSGSAVSPRAHLNLSWTRNAARTEEQRRNLFGGAAGVSISPGPHTTLIFDLVRELEEDNHREANLVEAGVRHQFGHSVLISAGAGAGFGATAEDYRLTLALSYGF